MVRGRMEPPKELPLSEQVKKLTERLERAEKLIDCLCIHATGWVGEKKQELHRYATGEILTRGRQAYQVIEFTKREEEMLEQYNSLYNEIVPLMEDLGDKIPDYIKLKRSDYNV